jgi:hypothetical protein
MFLQLRSLLFSVLLLVPTATRTGTVAADTVLLADCPQEPDVQGTFRNNGQYCVRERQVLSRDVVDATCPDNYVFKGGKCRFSGGLAKKKTIKPSCPASYQRFGDKCQKKCPNKEYRQKYKDCILPRKVLGTHYMTCTSSGANKDHDVDHDVETSSQEYHRYEAYCCIPGETCPQLQCNLGNQVPGKFFYTDDGKCERQVQTLPRTVVSKKSPLEEGGGKKPSDCPDGLQQVWGACQEPCPYGYRPLKGKCELRPCVFDPMTEQFVECPEATYKVSQTIF